MQDNISLKDFWAKSRGYPILVFGTCFLGWGLASMDQSFLAYAIPGIREEFGAGIDDIGWVLALSFIFAAFTSALIGILTDRYGRRAMFVFCIAFSALMVGLHALVIGLVSLTVLRMFAFGISNGLSPITNSYVAETAPSRYRGLLVALLQCGYPIGWFVASLFVVPLIAAFGWRYIFLPALLVIPIAFILARRLPESERFKQTRREQQELGLKSSEPLVPLGKIKELFAPDLRHRTIVIFIAFFFYGGAYAGTAFYFPSYFHEFRGYSVEAATALVGMSYGVGILGYLAVAFLGEFWITRRNISILWTLFGATAILGLVWLPTSYFQDQLWFGAMAALTYGNAASLTMLMAEIFPTRVRATAAGFAASFPLNIGHALFPVFTAWGIENIGWQWAFTLGVTPPFLIAALALTTLPNHKSGLSLEEIAQ